MENINIIFDDVEKQDIARLKELLDNSGWQTEFYEIENKNLDESSETPMGIGEIIALAISSGTIAALISALQIWLKNKRTSIIIEKDGNRIEINTADLEKTEQIIDSVKDFLSNNNKKDGENDNTEDNDGIEVPAESNEEDNTGNSDADYAEDSVEEP